MGIFQFLSEVKSELSKVIWPTRGETVRYTLTVVGFSLFVALVLGAADFGLIKLFEQLLIR